MPVEKENKIMVHFRTSKELRERLAHHAKRIGTDMNDIVREATMIHIEHLDEKEALYKERKKQDQHRALVPQVIQHPWGKPRGLGTKTKETPLTTPTMSFLVPQPPPVAVPKKIITSFRYYARHLEEANNEDDAKTRAEYIRDDIRKRVKSDEEAQASINAFEDFMVQRLEAKETKEAKAPTVAPETVSGESSAT